MVAVVGSSSARGRASYLAVLFGRGGGGAGSGGGFGSRGGGSGGSAGEVGGERRRSVGGRSAGVAVARCAAAALEELRLGLGLGLGLGAASHCRRVAVAGGGVWEWASLWERFCGGRESVLFCGRGLVCPCPLLLFTILPFIRI